MIAVPIDPGQDVLHLEQRIYAEADLSLSDKISNSRLFPNKHGQSESQEQRQLMRVVVPEIFPGITVAGPYAVTVPDKPEPAAKPFRQLFWREWTVIV